MLSGLNVVSTRLLGWLPLGVLLLLLAGLLGAVRLTLMPELRLHTQDDLQRRAERMAQHLHAEIHSPWLALQQLARQARLVDGGLGPAAAQSHLEWLRVQQPAWDWIGLADAQGRVLAATGGRREGESVSQWPAFVRSWASGHFVGPVGPAADPGALRGDQVARAAPGLYLAVRLHDAQGRPQGVLLGRLGTHWLELAQRQALAGLPAGHSVQARVWTGPPWRPMTGAAAADPQTEAMQAWVDAGGVGPPPPTLLAALQPVAALTPAQNVQSAPNTEIAQDARSGEPPGERSGERTGAWSAQVLLTRELAEALHPAHRLWATIAWPGLLALAVAGASGYWWGRRRMPGRNRVPVPPGPEPTPFARRQAQDVSPDPAPSPLAVRAIVPASVPGSVPASACAPPKPPWWVTGVGLAAPLRPPATTAPLATQAQYLRRVLDQLPVGVVLSGRAMDIEHVNATLTRQLGWTNEAVRGHLDGAFLCLPEDREPLTAQLRALVATPGELLARFTARQSDGTPRAVQWHFVPLMDGQGGFEGGVSVVMDIDDETTARRRAAALDQRLRLLLEVAVDHALVLLDDDGRVLSWNVGAVRVFGLTPSRARGSGFADLFDSDARVVGQPQRLLQQASAAGRCPVDGPLQHASGRPLHGVGSLYAMPPQAWPAAYALIARDVTAQQAAAQRLVESEARLAAVVGGASDAIVSVDELGLVKLFNHAAEQIFGRSASSVLGQPLDVLLPSEARLAHAQAVKGFQRAGEPMRRMSAGQVWGVRADGVRLPLEALISQAQVGGRTVMTAILRDVTARLQAEQALQRYQDELADLTQRLLAQEKETTRRLAQTLHDDLGQTITAMRLTYDACRSVFPAEGVFAQRLERLSDLIAAAYGQVRQALVELRPPLLDDLGLAPALANEVAVRRGAHPEQRLQITLPPHLEEQRWPPTVEYAAFMIAREALQNALQHSGATKVSLLLDGDAHRLQLEVRDNGVGLPATGAQKPGHLGLVGMRERALAIGATLSVVSRSTGGMAMRLAWEDNKMTQTP